MIIFIYKMDKPKLIYNFLPISIQFANNNSEIDDIYDMNDTGIDAFISYLNIAYNTCKEIKCLYFANEIIFSSELRYIIFFKEGNVYYNTNSFDVFNIDDDMNRYLVIGYEHYIKQNFKAGNNYAYNSEIYNIGNNIKRWLSSNKLINV